MIFTRYPGEEEDRLVLRVVSLRVESLHDITEEDAGAEGPPECECTYGPWGRGEKEDALSLAAGGKPWSTCWGPCGGMTAREWFADAWDRGVDGNILGMWCRWMDNPVVVVYGIENEGWWDDESLP
jgi:hypothetical protein